MTTLFVGCSEWEDTVTPSPQAPEGCQGVFFPSSNQAVFELEPADALELTLTVSRTLSAGSVDVPIIVETNKDDVFVVPSSVTFADGETEVDFKVTFPQAGEGIAYDLKLAVEGDNYINPYGSAKPYVTTMVSRIKWEDVAEPMVYVDGAIAALFGVGSLPMYVEAQKAQLGASVRYRFKNAYDVATGQDADGIYDGYPYNDPGDFDETKDYYTTIEISDPSGTSGDVVMSGHEIGVDWGYGIKSIGSVDGEVGQIKDGIITFGSGALYLSLPDYNAGTKYPSSTPTTIYTTKEAFIAANLKIEDFNDVEYTTIVGEVSEFASMALNDSWEQTIAKAVDADPENDESDYKDLYYLADLYAEGKGLAFYYKNDAILIPEMQPLGINVFGEPVYISQSRDIKSSVIVGDNGVTEYTLGVVFHYEDGTIVGEFAEKQYYAKVEPSYDISAFIGDFVMTGPSALTGRDDANVPVVIAEGTEDNSLVITGLQYAEEVLATFDPATSTMSIAPQVLADFGDYDVDLQTINNDGDVSTTAVLAFKSSIQGKLSTAPTSEAFGYLLNSNLAGGFISGYYNLLFTPVASSSASVKSTSSEHLQVSSPISSIERTVKPKHNFKIQGKLSPKTIR
ncbi:hypothetical protein [Carboxylicivirga sp. N1Y90]|uniref:hypothetical protein n=1 Tax=Carboxylicivirga fragile TaxID=3417571 RepID=UPI003D3390E2|nr:hypothetical protein [Marinilabiliaceae bacterium N1Y90]